MAITPDQAYQQFLIKRTQVEMLADRGYEIPEDEIDLFLTEEAMRPGDAHLISFIDRYKSPKTKMFSREEMTQSYSNNQGNITYVYYAPLTVKGSQGIGTVTTFVDQAKEATTAIIISNQGFTPAAKSALNDITEPHIQIFFDRGLYVNPTKHVMTPRHTRLALEERNKIIKQAKTEPSLYEKISIDDPVVVYYGWKVGDMIQIDRVNLATQRSMARKSIAYRIVGGIAFPPEKAPVKKPTKAT